MLELVFVKLLEISIQASLFILAVILIRLCFMRLPKRYVYVLWTLVAVRLVLPFEINSAFSLVPDTSRVFDWADVSLSENVPASNNQTTENTPVQDNLLSPENTVQSDMAQSKPLVQNSPTQDALQPNASTQNNTGLNNTIPDGTSNSTGATTLNLASLLSRIWLLGTLALLAYDLASYLRLKFRLRESIHAQDNIWYSDQIPAPFVLGYLKPRIFIPFSIRKEQMPYIIAHEQAHISHFDHLSKLLAALLVCVYWFNPFIWIAYLLYCKDLELACDERVIAKLGNEEKKPYSEALLICSVSNKALLQSPLSFSEVAIKNRIVNILKYKKPGFWGVVLALVVCIVAGTCFLTNPASQEESPIDAKTLEFVEQTTVELLDQVTVTYRLEDGFHDLPDTLGPDAYCRILTYGTKDLQFYGLINGEAMILRDGDIIYPLYDLQWPRLNANDSACINIYKYDYDSDGELEYALYKVQTDQNGIVFTGMTILEIEDSSLHIVPFTLADIETQLERISFEYADDEETIAIYIDSEDPAAILDVAWVNKMYNQSFTRLNSLSEGVFLRERDHQVEISTFVGFIQPEEEPTGYVAASFSAPVTYSADGKFLIGDITIDYSLEDPDLVTQYSTQLDDYPGTAQHTGANEFISSGENAEYTPTPDMLKAMSEDTPVEDRPKDITIYHSESRSDEELAVLYEGDGYSLYLPLSWNVNVEGLAAPIKMTSEGSNYRRVWIEYYENADFSDVEEQFITDGYIYNTDTEKWQKTEGTTITKARLVTLENGICAILSYHDEAYPEEPWEDADAMADTCIITDIPEKNTPVQEPYNVYYPTNYYYSPAQYMKDIDWNNVSDRITNEENEALQKYLPVLNSEEEFIWIYLINDGTYNTNEGIHAKKQVTIRELLAEQYGMFGIEAVEPIVDSFCFADIFQTGSTDMAMLLRNQDYEWLLFHEEDGVIYCIDMYVRWFHSLQEDGLYMGSSGADHQSYHRLSFADGDFAEEMVAEIIRDELYIDGVKQSAAEYEAWKKANLADLVPVYTPLEEAAVSN